MRKGVKTTFQIIWHSFHWELGLCSCPLNLGSVIVCQTEYAKNDAVSLPELGREKWAATAPVSWILMVGTQPPCSEEAQAAQGEAQLKRNWGPWLAPTELSADSYHQLSSHVSRLSLEVTLPSEAEPKLPCRALPNLQTHKSNKWFLCFLSH